LIFDGTLNQELFAEYIKIQLKSMMAKDDVLILDNCSVHKSKLAMKTFLKKAKARTHKALEKAINLAFNWICESDIQGLVSTLRLYDY
jgi:hypothetical protein